MIWFYGEWARGGSNINTWGTWVGSFKTSIPITLTNEINSQNAGGTLRIVDIADIPSGQSIDLPVESSNTARTLNERFPNWHGSGITYKHHHWNSDLSEYKLNHTFTATSGAAQTQKAIFTGLDPIRVTAELIETGGTANEIQFRDPWWVDANGNQPNIFRPFTPPMDSSIFLNQPIVSGRPYYSVGAPSPNTFIIGAEERTGYFLNWTGSNVALQNANATQTGVVFQQSGATATARYKAHLASSSPNALSTSSQRKVVRDYSGKLHMVYESVGEIWYTNSTNGGATWSPEKLISDLDLVAFVFVEVAKFGRQGEKQFRQASPVFCKVILRGVES